MAVRLQEIKAPINKELEVFEKKFRLSMKSKVPLLDTIMSYIVKRKGKQLRPMFVLLTSKIFGQINERTYRGAALVELLHTATLVHDDVVDESYERRGLFSINALWKNKIAVLVGDYLLSKGLLLALRNRDHDMLEILSDAVEQMSEGELLQIEKARRLDITEDIYYDIISKKTASLIASCCGIGAASTCADENVIENMRSFGLKVGIAFQIKDDLFDYGSADIGKPTGIDIKEKKMTLPLIYSLNQASKSEKRRIINIVKNNNNDPKKVKEVITFVINSGGIAYAENAMKKYLQEALDRKN
jgi:octaprenyl-diphosphate synthase